VEIVQHDYQAGRPWAVCDRCAQQYRLDELTKEWSGLMVCSDCWDPKPDTLSPPVIYPEGQPYPDARPDQPAVFVGTVTPDNL